MAIKELTMPALGMAQTDGTIVDWLKNVGDTVEEEETLLQVETDKTVMDIPSPSGGVIVEIIGAPGMPIPIGDVIAKIETDASLVDYDTLPTGPTPNTATESPPEQTVEGAEPISEPPEEVIAEERVVEKSPPKTKKRPSKKQASPIEQGKRGKVLASPLARVIAEEQGIDPADLRKDSSLHEPYQSSDVWQYLSSYSDQGHGHTFVASVPLEKFHQLLEWAESNGKDVWTPAQFFVKICITSLVKNEYISEYYGDEECNMKHIAFHDSEWHESYVCDIKKIMRAEKEFLFEDVPPSDFHIVCEYISHNYLLHYSANDVGERSDINIRLIVNNKRNDGILNMMVSDKILDVKNALGLLDMLVRVFETPLFLLG